MITTLSYTIAGRPEIVAKNAALFMTTMGEVMGKKINGTTLVEIARRDEHISVAKFKKRQIDSMFPKK